MNGSVAIEQNHEALKRIVASLMAMAGLAGGAAFTSPLRGSEGRVSAGSQPPPDDAAGRATCLARPSDPLKGEVEAGHAATLPRHLWLAVLRLLRPAEAAARRLIIAAARGLVVEPPRQRAPRPKPEPIEPLLRRLGIAIVVSPADLAAEARRARAKGGKGDGGVTKPCAGRVPAFPLLDPLSDPFAWYRRPRVAARSVPRILCPGVIEPFRLPPPLSRDDPIDAARLALRLAALAAALDDLPGQARRFARWKANRDALCAQEKRHDAAIARNKRHDGLRAQGGTQARRRIRRFSPLRGGPPPGGRLTRWEPGTTGGRRGSGPLREIDYILAHCHALARYALEYPDTS
ncbi:MAG: hypothetical protein K5872_14390 [Rhizobiaceae bacterium]|nr:hypothetical protein [Rhizobiaceae bacterium]